MTNTNDYVAFMFEQISEQNRAVLEAVGDMQQNVKYIPGMREDIASLKSDMSVIKLAIRDISRLVNKH